MYYITNVGFCNRQNGVCREDCAVCRDFWPDFITFYLCRLSTFAVFMIFYNCKREKGVV